MVQYERLLCVDTEVQKCNEGVLDESGIARKTAAEKCKKGDGKSSRYRSCYRDRMAVSEYKNEVTVAGIKITDNRNDPQKMCWMQQLLFKRQVYGWDEVCSVKEYGVHCKKQRRDCAWTDRCCRAGILDSMKSNRSTQSHKKSSKNRGVSELHG